MFQPVRFLAETLGVPLTLAFIPHLVQVECFNRCPSSESEMDSLKDIQVLLTGKRTQ